MKLYFQFDIMVQLLCQPEREVVTSKSALKVFCCISGGEKTSLLTVHLVVVRELEHLSEP